MSPNCGRSKPTTIDHKSTKLTEKKLNTTFKEIIQYESSFFEKQTFESAWQKAKQLQYQRKKYHNIYQASLVACLSLYIFFHLENQILLINRSLKFQSSTIENYSSNL